jgi:hypothetical protein
VTLRKAKQWPPVVVDVRCKYEQTIGELKKMVETKSGVTPDKQRPDAVHPTRWWRERAQQGTSFSPVWCPDEMQSIRWGISAHAGHHTL